MSHDLLRIFIVLIQYFLFEICKKSIVFQSLPEVLEQAEKAFHCLSSHLGTKNYLMGDRPSEADALLFGKDPSDKTEFEKKKNAIIS